MRTRSIAAALCAAGLAIAACNAHGWGSPLVRSQHPVGPAA